jgi:hypothetical protein
MNKELSEMARAKVTYTLDQSKKAQLKKVIDAVKGNTKAALAYLYDHNTLSLADLAKELGKDPATLNNPGFRKLMTDLTSRGIISTGGEAVPSKPSKPASPKMNKTEVPSTDSEVDFEKEMPSEKDVAAGEKEFGDVGAERLTPADQERFDRLNNAIRNKVSKIELLTPKERTRSNDLVVLKQIIAKPEVKKLFASRGLDVMDLVSSVIS